MHANCLPHASVSVIVNEEVLQEIYTRTSPTGATIFIETVDGAAFEVELELEEGFAHSAGQLDFELYLDGKWVGGLLVDLHQGPQSERMHDFLENSSAGQGTRKFMFAHHHTTEEEDSDTTLRDELDNIGEIKVTLTRCKKHTRNIKQRPGQEVLAIADDQVSERALKGRAISNHVKFGDVKLSDSPVAVRGVTYLYSSGNTPIATYIFNYRPRKDLQMVDLIERSRSPTPLEDRDIDNLTLEEARELVRRSREETRIKQEREVKREQSALSGKSATSEQSGTSGRDNNGYVSCVRTKHAKAIIEDAIDLTEED